MQDQDALLALGILGRTWAGFLGIHVRKFAANRSNLSRFAGGYPEKSVRQERRLNGFFQIRRGKFAQLDLLRRAVRTKYDSEWQGLGAIA